MAKNRNRGQSAPAASAPTQPEQPAADGAAPKEKAARVYKGDPTNGVRAHPSYDNPGKFYVVEASSRKRPIGGYHTVEEIIEIAKTNGWNFLGVVDVRGTGKGSKAYDKDSVAAAVKAHGAYQRKVAAKPEAEVAEGEAAAVA